MFNKTFAAAAVVGAAALASAVPAAAQTYVEATAGWTTQPDLDWNGADWEMDDGEHYGVAVGRHFRPEVAVELELMRTRTNYACCSDNDLVATALMANAFYRFTPEARVRPYVGAGLGMARIEYKPDPGVDRKDDVFAWQAMAGVEVPFSPRLSGFAEYRYQDAATAQDGSLEWEYLSHNVGLGLRYSF